MRASGLLLHWQLWLGAYSVGFNYLLNFPPYYVALCASKALHRLSSESVSWCLETSPLSWLPPQDRSVSLTLLSLFLSFIFCLTSFQRQWAAFLGAWCPLPAFRSCLWNLLSFQMFFWWICGGESGLPILFLCHIRTTLLCLSLYFILNLFLCFKITVQFCSFAH